MPHRRICPGLHGGDARAEAPRDSRGASDGVGEPDELREQLAHDYGPPVRTTWVIVLCVLGCATTSQAPPASSPRITVSEPGGQVTLTVGQELAMQLQGNVTTGYVWELVAPVPDVLTVIDPGTYRASNGSEPRVGAGGTASFVFRAARPGKGVLELVYRRPWERDAPPARMVRVDVDVR